MNKKSAEERRQEILATENYYEYSQYIKTMFMKNKMRRKFDEMKALIRQALIDLGERKQQGLAADMFDNYFKEHVLKMQSLMADKLGEIEDEFLYELCCLLVKYGKSERSVQQLETVVDKCVSTGFIDYNRQLCREIAKLHMANQIYSRAYTCYLRGLDVDGAQRAMAEVMKEGYKTEYDLFVVRLCLEVLIRFKATSGAD